MEKPDLERMWETRIKVGPKRNLTYKMFQDTIRHEIASTFPPLLEEGKIRWYHFLYHRYPEDESNAYFHIRFSPGPIDLPEYCVATKKIDPLRGISGVNKSLLKNEEIEEAWRILGEQSQWIIGLINIHKEDKSIPIKQIVKFMHFYTNMLWLGNQCRIKIDNQWVPF